MPSSDPNLPRVPGWKKSVPQGSPERVARHGWQRQPLAPPTAAPSKLSRRVRQIGAVAGFLTALAALVVVIYWLSPARPSCLLILADDYASNLVVPPNVYGLRTGTDLEAVTQNQGSTTFPTWLFGSSTVRLHASPEKPRGALTLPLGSFSEKTIVAYIGLHGAADQEHAYLLVDDADSPLGVKRIPVKELIDQLAGLPKEKNKLLILDATQIQAEWSLGILHNNFVRKLIEELDGSGEQGSVIADIPNLAVISSSSPEELSWGSEEWQRTIFGHYLAEGMRGACVGDGSRISAKKLFEYVKTNVTRWARENRASQQVPLVLPRGEEGLQRLARMEITVPPSTYTPLSPTEAPGAVFKYGEKLKTVWQQQADLGKRVPHPASYAPQQWHRYQELLLRYEWLLRQGDEEGAGLLLPVINRQHESLSTSGVLELSSVQNALPMGPALGLQPPWEATSDRSVRSTLDRQLDALRNTPEGERPSRWADMREKLSKELGLIDKQVRIYFAQSLLEDLQARPTAETYQRVCDLITVISDGQPMPAEAHFLVMTRAAQAHLQDRPVARLAIEPEWLDLVAEALRLRVLAEQAALSADPRNTALHPYAEQVVPWLREDLDAADADRRTGENLLFAEGANHLATAKQRLKAARDRYVATLRTAAILRDAFQTRDTLFGKLPYYARWVATTRERQAEGASAPDIFLVSNVNFRNLCAEVHRLAQRLETPDPTGITETPQREEAWDPVPKSLQERMEGLRNDMGLVVKGIDDEASDLANRTAILPKSWDKIQQLLQIPFLAPEVRVSLIKRSREISNKLNVEARPDSATPPAPEDPALLQARSQVRMAVETLGYRRLTEFVGVESADFFAADFQALLAKLSLVTSSAAWQDNISAIGKQLQINLENMRSRTGELLENSRQVTLRDAADDLQRSERWSRLMPGKLTGRIGGPTPVEPAEAAHRMRTHVLLARQAHRTYLDFWASENPNVTAYYRMAGDRYLTDARTLLDELSASDLAPGVKTDRSSLIDSGRKELMPATLQVVARSRDQRFDLTSEKQLDARHFIQCGPEVPTGEAVVLAQAQESTDRLVELLSPGPRDRLLLTVGKDRQPTFDLVFKSPYLDQQLSSTSPQTKPRNSALLVRGVYRGHHLDRPTEVVIYPSPDLGITLLDNTDRSSGFALRADPRLFRDSATLVVILDCSGSMGTKQPNGKTRFDIAREALVEVLGGLPQGIRLSIWVWGQNARPNDREKELEDTISRLTASSGPIRWNPNNTEELKRQLDGLKAEGLTPIVRSMMEARSDFQRAPGYRSMVVITDGMDTRFEKRAEVNQPGKPYLPASSGDPKYNPNGTIKIPDFLENNFANEGIDIQMVGFQVAPSEAEESQAQFKGAIQKLGGTYYDSVNDRETLVKNLKRALLERLPPFRLEDSNGTEVRLRSANPDGSYEVTPKGYRPRYHLGLIPNAYTLTLTGYRQGILTRRGELLLGEYLGESKFKRVVFASEPENLGRPKEENGQWVSTLLKNQLVRGGAEMYLSLEDKDETLASVGKRLQQVEPGFVWMEVRPKGAVKPAPVQWANLSGYPAPAFQIRASDWSPQTIPQLDLWWTKDRLPEVSVFLSRDLTKTLDADFDQPSKRETQVDGDRFTVESVKYERRFVRLADGQRVEENCLVVRASYDEGREVMVVLNGQNIDARQHLFYARAGKYTGIFYPITKDQAEKGNFELGLISVRKFKEDRAKTLHTTFSNLSPPSDQDMAPDRRELPPLR